MSISKSILLSVFVSIFVASVSAQFVDVNVEISADRLKEKERNDLKTLELQLPQYFESYQWIDDSYGMKIPLSIRLFPQSMSEDGFERVFTGQVFISNGIADQRFYEKSFKFVYNTNDPLVHQEIPHSLTSTLDFYAWMMIAGELDTYEPLGGNAMYEKARDIAQRAQMSERPHGWKKRIQVLEDILRVRDYRMFKYYWWSIIDLLDQGKTKEVPAAIDKTLAHLEKVFIENARERYTHIFLDVHARKFMKILKDHGTKQQREKLIALDPDNEKVYKLILKQ